MVFKLIIVNDLPGMELISRRGEASLGLMVMRARWQSISQLGAGMALPVIIHVTLAKSVQFTSLFIAITRSESLHFIPLMPASNATSLY